MSVGVPHQKHSPTSKAAARSIKPKLPSLKAVVFSFVSKCGEYGCTDEQAQMALGMDPSTQRPRRVELVREGWVANSGRQRLTQSNRMATVWVAAKFMGGRT